MAIRRRYYISYRVFGESEYSGFPVQGKQTYLIGIRNDLNGEQFEFPSSLSYGGYKNLYEYLDRDPDWWYRRLPSKFYYDKEFEVRKFYVCGLGGVVSETPLITQNMIRPTYIHDGIGPRRFTHNEYAMFKGYPKYDFNICKNKSQMYVKLFLMPNIYLVREIAASIYKFLSNSAVRPYIKDFKQITETKLTANKEIRDNNKRPIFYPKSRIKSVTIDNLKGLKNINITFNKSLMAIMGVNGAGKSTILHALACSFLPVSENLPNYKFSFFFTPNTDALWDNSKFSITYFDENNQQETVRGYRKKSQRWYPPYSTRPLRDVHYIGIDSGLPEIEKEKQTTYINYSTDVVENKNSAKILEAAAVILNKDYKQLTINKTKRKEFIGVCTKSDLKYSSLSMGAGEQRLLKILNTVYNANTYSLILIDEIDLLLHVNAQKQLIRVLNEVAEKRHLQIVFTTHSLDIADMSDFVDIRYLYQTSDTTLVYDRITPDIIYDIKHENKVPVTIYVEDDLAKALVNQVAASLDIQGNVAIKTVGSVHNMFVTAAYYVIDEQDVSNVLFVIDGDVYRTKEEKLGQTKRYLTGTEQNHKEKIERAVMAMTQFNLPDNTPPEKHIHNMLTNIKGKSEIKKYANNIKAVTNSHEWVNEIIYQMNCSREIGLYRIICELENCSDEWDKFTEPVRKWLTERKCALHLGE